jgi:hypothetical protein
MVTVAPVKGQAGTNVEQSIAKCRWLLGKQVNEPRGLRQPPILGKCDLVAF